MDHVKAKSEIIELARKFKRALIKNHIRVEEVVLFGSHVHGTAKPWSDIDIGVISPDVSGLHLDDFPRLRRISEPLDLAIEPHGLTPEQYHSPEHGLACEIKKTGIII